MGGGWIVKQEGKGDGFERQRDAKEQELIYEGKTGKEMF